VLELEDDVLTDDWLLSEDVEVELVELVDEVETEDALTVLSDTVDSEAVLSDSVLIDSVLWLVEEVEFEVLVDKVLDEEELLLEDVDVELLKLLGVLLEVDWLVLLKEFVGDE